MNNKLFISTRTFNIKTFDSYIEREKENYDHIIYSINTINSGRISNSTINFESDILKIPFFLNFQKNFNFQNNIFKLEIKGVYQNQDVFFQLLEIKVIHRNIECNQCKVLPIIGIRYKCSSCNNYNLCEKCEINSKHEHLFLKCKNELIENGKIINL
jgi:hypothetical protein